MSGEAATPALGATGGERGDRIRAKFSTPAGEAACRFPRANPSAPVAAPALADPGANGGGKERDARRSNPPQSAAFFLLVACCRQVVEGWF